MKTKVSFRDYIVPYDFVLYQRLGELSRREKLINRVKMEIPERDFSRLKKAINLAKTNLLLDKCRRGLW